MSFTPILISSNGSYANNTVNDNPKALGRANGDHFVKLPVSLATVALINTTIDASIVIIPNGGSPQAPIPLSVDNSSSPTKYEAETGTLTGSSIIATDHLNYTGTGFIAQNIAVNSGVTIPITASVAGNATVSIRYANGTGSTNTLSIYVNAVKIKQESFPATADWDTWVDMVETLTLNAGSNTITIQFDAGDTGHVNIDSITVTNITYQPTNYVSMMVDPTLDIIYVSSVQTGDGVSFISKYSVNVSGNTVSKIYPVIEPNNSATLWIYSTPNNVFLSNSLAVGVASAVSSAPGTAGTFTPIVFTFNPSAGTSTAQAGGVSNNYLTTSTGIVSNANQVASVVKVGSTAYALIGMPGTNLLKLYSLTASLSAATGTVLQSYTMVSPLGSNAHNESLATLTTDGTNLFIAYTDSTTTIQIAKWTIGGTNSTLATISGLSKVTDIQMRYFGGSLFLAWCDGVTQANLEAVYAAYSTSGTLQTARTVVAGGDAFGYQSSKLTNIGTQLLYGYQEGTATPSSVYYTNLTGPQTGATSMVGVGIPTITAAQQNAGSAIQSGVGSVLASGTISSPASVSFSGVAKLVVLAAVYPMSTIMQGVSWMTPTATNIMATPTVMQGVGALTADVTDSVADSVNMQGVGSMVAQDMAIIFAASQMNFSSAILTARSTLAVNAFSSSMGIGSVRGIGVFKKGVKLLVADILLMADINVPNNLQNSIKILFLNEICKQLYREFPIPDEVYPFFTMQGNAFYPLPSDCLEDRITSIQVGDRNYTFRLQDERDMGYSWSIVADTICLYPTPTDAQLGYIFYQPQPSNLSEFDLTTEPDFPMDFREALIFGISKRIAMTLPTPNLNLASYYGNEMNQLVLLAKQKLHRPKKQVAIHRRWL